jgi:hypothetical protein
MTKLSSEIFKEAVDIQTTNKIKMLWQHYKDDISQFAKKVGETIRSNGLSFNMDRNWITSFLKKLTGEDWVVNGKDFVLASNKKIKK